MAVQLGALRDALMNPGDAILAAKAAEEVAAYESQFSAIKLELVGIKGDVALLKWMLALLIGGVATLVIKAFG